MTTSIPSPGQAMSDVDSQIICEAAIELPVRELVDAIIQAGWQPMVVYAAMKVVAERQGNAYTEDPDPSDDPGQDRAPSRLSLAPF